MTDRILKENVTCDIPRQVPGSGVPLTEVEIRGLWSIQASRDHDLNSLAQAVLAETPRFGEMLCRDALRWIYLWPHKAYLRSTEISPPELPADCSSMLTDISHGFCELSLKGSNPLEFLDNYTSVDLGTAENTTKRNLRCLLGQYQIILWWDDITEVHILVDRSYAQSFRDYLDTLFQRWSATCP